MHHRSPRIDSTLWLAGLTTIVLGGCFPANNNLPATVIVELPDGTSVEVEQGGGAPSLADSSWRFFRVTGAAQQANAFVTITFGPGGALEKFDNSTFAQQVFGSTILFDGQQHATSQEGIAYAASTFGAETSDGTGFSFEGRLTAFFTGLPVGGADANATGTFEPDDPNTMTGTFTFSTELSIPIPIEGVEVNDEFDFIARRVIE